jgi:hypothetical protein
MDNQIEKSLAFYKGTGYGVINAKLRENYIYDEDIGKKEFKSDKILNDIANIDAAIKRSGKSNSGTKVYRGLSHFVFQDQNEFIEKGYSSTTTDIDIATKSYTDGKCCVLFFEIPNNVNSYTYQEKSYKESEILIQRNIQYLNIQEFGEVYGVNIFTCNIKPYSLPSKTEVKMFETQQGKLRKQLMQQMLLELDDEIYL